MIVSGSSTLNMAVHDSLRALEACSGVSNLNHRITTPCVPVLYVTVLRVRRSAGVRFRMVTVFWIMDLPYTYMIAIYTASCNSNR